MATENELLIIGATVTDLAQLFGIDRKDVRARIGDIPPRAKRGNLDVWRVRDVASRLVKLDDNMTETVRRILATHHTDLPKMLSKEFWYGQNQRLRYMIAVGDLWDTPAVVELASEVFKTLRLSLMLASDSVERSTGLTEAQREIIENLMHEALNNAREKLVVNLANGRKNTSGKAFAPTEGNPGIAGTADGGDEPERDEWGDIVGEDDDDL